MACCVISLSLRNPDRPDQVLAEAAAEKIRKHRSPYIHKHLSTLQCAGRVYVTLETIAGIDFEADSTVSSSMA
jgi:hypothetical protein